MNHDLRTPLNAVIGFSDLMQREMFGPLGNERYQEYARHIRDSGDILLRATEDALAMTTLLANPSQGGLRRIALSELVRTLRLDLEREDCPAVVHVPATCNAFIVAEPVALAQAIRHVIHAALSHPGRILPVEIEATVMGSNASLTVGIGQAPAVVCERSPQAEQGLGRETMSIHLARVLLGLQGMRMSSEVGSSSWQARIDLGAALQQSRPAKPLED